MKQLPWLDFPIYVAPRWKLWAARLFGRRVEGRDGDHVCIAYQWRGKVYIVKAL